jgi:2-amino-4-hydroxy-6-hydroxymethyldihydropteridine diphosphokinase
MSKDFSQPVALALGGNLGQPRETFCRACALLAAGGVSDLRMASCYRSEAVDCHPGTPPFTNSALIGHWSGTARELLELTQEIELQLGRPRVHDSQGSRSIDIDILLLGDLILESQELCLPHPRMCERLFVLQPLAEIAPDWIIPTNGKTVAQIMKELKTG